MVTIDKFVQGAASYIESEILPQMTLGKKIAVGTAVALVARNPLGILDKYIKIETLQALGIISEDRKAVDVEVLAEEVKKRIPPEGVRFEIPAIHDSLTFFAEDVSKLMNRILNS